MRKIVVLNAKGGAGKTTLAVNLASYYAHWGIKVEIADLDPQQSTMGWLKTRGRDTHLVKSARVSGYEVFPRADTEYLIIDAPSGTHGDVLRQILGQADTAVIPVLPSPLDIRAAGHFIFEILSHESFDHSKVRLGVLANRVKANTLMFHTLERFLFKLDIPFITVLRDSQNYVKSIEKGLSVFELPGKQAEKDLTQWQPLLAWLNHVPTLPKPVILHDAETV